MEKNDIVSTFVYFTDSSNGKHRPVLILDDNGGDIEFFKLTTKYANKSPEIQKKYFKINDWKAAGLYKPTWINTYPIATMPKSLANFKPVGKLSVNDIQRLAAFINSSRNNK